jgi:hypothetical protein
VFDNISPETRKTIAAEYAGGAKMVPLMRKHRIAYTTIKRVLEAEGISARPIGYYVPPESRAEILRIFDGGMSVLTIKQRTGYSYAFIRKWLVENGRMIPTISQGSVRSSGLAHFDHLKWPTRMLIFCLGRSFKSSGYSGGWKVTVDRFAPVA